MMTDFVVIFSSELIRYISLGFIRMGILTLACSVIVAVILFGSLVYTFACFLIVPLSPVVLTFNSIFPSPPGGMILSNWTTEQPQPVLTLLISRVLSQVLITLNSLAMTLPSLTFFSSNTFSSRAIVGLP